MKTTRDFCSADRYLYDFKHCTRSNGWAQIDTSQDAWYYGTWCNPTTLKIFTYCEGDLILNQAATVDEFVEEIRSIKRWNEENGHRFIGIDPLLSEPIYSQLEDMGLGDLLH